MKTSLMLVALTASLAGFAWAGENDNDEGPGRGVARVSVINGDVSVRRGDSGDWVAAAINAPLVVEDRLLTGPASRAEIQFDYANMLRLASDSEVRLAELEYQRYIVQVARGTVTFRVLRDSRADLEISTPSVSVRPVKRGIYRVTVHDDGSSEITVRSGDADIYTPRGTERLHAGRTMLARGTASDPEYQVVNAVSYDDWDRWNESRDRDLERSRAYASNYVPPDVYGADDLDPYGSWVYAPTYGYVWSPRVAVGWAPYRYGRWVWIDWYGWTWVSYDPWGWAPYHYGRWFWYGNSWCWWPGGFTRHYWSPALVAFFGFGHGGVGLGFGRVGWVPLAPHEPFYPWYGRRYYGGFRNTTINNVQVVNNVNITNVYRNSRVANGLTGVDGTNFGRGGGNNFVRVSNNDIQRANVVHGVLPVTPDRSSLRWSDREVRPQLANTRTADNGRFFSRRQPAQVERVPFDQQQRSMDQFVRRSAGDSPRVADGGSSRQSVGDTGRAVADPGRGGRTSAVDAPRMERQGGAETGRTAETPRSSDGWRRVGDTTRTERAPAATDRTTGGGAGAEGWRRFGDSGNRPDAVVRTPDRTTETPRAVDRGASRGNDGGQVRNEARPADNGWRKFGDPGRPVERPSVQREDRGSRMESRPQTRNEAPARSTPDSGSRGGEMRRSDAPSRTETPRSETPRSEPRRDPGRSDPGRTDRFQQDFSQRVPVSPPVVRERMSAPRMESPRMESPRMSAPRSAPEFHGGGGGFHLSGGKRRQPLSRCLASFPGALYLFGGHGRIRRCRRPRRRQPVRLHA